VHEGKHMKAGKRQEVVDSSYMNRQLIFTITSSEPATSLLFMNTSMHSPRTPAEHTYAWLRMQTLYNPPIVHTVKPKSGIAWAALNS
jgi:hypothetical protein